MYSLIVLILALTDLPAVAHEAHRAARASLDLGAAVVVSPRPGFDEPSPAEVQDRLSALMNVTRLRTWMFTLKPLTREQTAFAAQYPLVPNEMAAPYLDALLNIEIDLARTFDLPLARVQEETDFMIGLDDVTVRHRDRADLIVGRLTARQFPPLGRHFDDHFANLVADARVRSYASERAALTKKFMTNLAGNLRRVVKRAGVIDFASHSMDAVGYARTHDWLDAPLPKEVAAADRELARQIRADARVARSNATPALGDEVGAAARRASLDVAARGFAPVESESARDARRCAALLTAFKRPLED